MAPIKQKQNMQKTKNWLIYAEVSLNLSKDLWWETSKKQAIY
jgi:hypothetical protein